jgi:CHASE2 domain-containing sensor protein
MTLAERRKHILVAAVTGGCIWLLLITLRAGGVLQGLELIAYDLTLAARARVANAPEPAVELGRGRIVIVDEDALDDVSEGFDE